MRAYYNEIDPFAAAWLRALIQRDLIADGDVDERSIADVRPADLAGYTQCHFFAGIGGWSYALRLAGWPDDRPVWTGSCPCQLFSAAGKGHGADDSRHLWPTWFQLISQCKPDVVFGEQVASPDGLAWFDAVSFDMEGADYAIGAVDLCAASVGAPHGRQRLFFLADARYALGRSDDSSELNLEGRHSVRPIGSKAAGVIRNDRQVNDSSSVADPNGSSRKHTNSGQPVSRSNRRDNTGWSRDNDPWADIIWIECRDGKRRPAPPEPEIFPLAPRLPGHVVRISGSGNSIVPQVAAEVIAAYMEVA